MESVIRADGGHTCSRVIEGASRIDSCIYQGYERALESKCHNFQWQQVDKNSLCLWQNSTATDLLTQGQVRQKKLGCLSNMK